MPSNLLAAACFAYCSVLGTLLASTQPLEPYHTNFDYSGLETLMLPIPVMVTISMYAVAHFHQIIITQQLQIRVTGIKSCSIVQGQCQLMNVPLSYGHDIKLMHIHINR